jgi:hypothetical protein
MANPNITNLLPEDFSMYRLLSAAGQVVENSEGFLFGSNDRESLKYSDEMGIATVYVDRGITDIEMVPATMRRWTKDMCPIRLSDDEISMITERIKAGWNFYSKKELVIDSRPTEFAAEPPQVLSWSVNGGTRRPIVIP